VERLRVIIEGSGKHVHVTRETLDKLYGEGFELEHKKSLSQPGQFSSNQKVDIIGPKCRMNGVTIIGPCRKVNQVELSYTDARTLGLNPPVRESGDITGSAPCTLVGPCGSVDISEGAIIAKRHLHCTPEDAEKYGIQNGEIVIIRVEGDRALWFDEVVARVSSSYATYAHIDYDEINAAALFSDTIYGTVYHKSEFGIDK